MKEYYSLKLYIYSLLMYCPDKKELEFNSSGNQNTVYQYSVIIWQIYLSNFIRLLHYRFCTGGGVRKNKNYYQGLITHYNTSTLRSQPDALARTKILASTVAVNSQCSTAQLTSTYKFVPFMGFLQNMLVKYLLATHQYSTPMRYYLDFSIGATSWQLATLCDTRCVYERECSTVILRFPNIFRGTVCTRKTK